MATTRRPYTRTDYRLVLQHYTQGGQTAAQLAAQLDRTVGSLRDFIHQHPELRKHSRPPPQSPRKSLFFTRISSSTCFTI